jgi:hypothetical protein
MNLVLTRPVVRFVAPVPAKSSKLCYTCKYFENGKCKLFASQDPVSGTLVYVDSSHARFNKNLCGPDGKYYKEK